MQGWIKLHRSFLDWEWKTSYKHVAVFLDLLLNANHKEKKYRGRIIKAGQLTTSYDAISKRTGITVRGVRTVLKDLKTTNEVTHETTRHYSIISIVNWDKFQVSDTQDDKLVTSRRQASDKLVTTNKNVKNVKNVINNKIASDIITHLNLVANKNFKPKSQATVRLINARLNEGYTLDDFKTVIDNKTAQWLNDFKMDKYLTPKTLFCVKHFDAYLNEKPVEKRIKDLTPDEAEKRLIAKLEEMDRKAESSQEGFKQ